jgi:hypothetical protein
MADVAFGQPLFVRYFSLRHTACGVTSQFANSVSHLFTRSFPNHPPDVSSDLITAVSHAGSLVSCHNFHNFML